MLRPYTGQVRRMRAAGMAVEVTRACDVNEAQRPLVEERFGPIPFDTDYRRVVEADDVDLVVVTTAMPAHGPVSKAALEAG
jgi:predicted dehydrogenase